MISVKELLIWLGHIFFYNRKSKIIYYHDVYLKKSCTSMSTPLSIFEKHLEILKNNNFEIVDDIDKSKNQVMICFDDGWKGIYEVKDFFVKNRIHPTIFLAIDLIGKDDYLSLDEILELQSLGFIFQGHSWSHKNLTKFDDKGLEKELLESKIELSRLLGKNIDSLCFPQGYFNKNVVDKAHQYGYNKLYSSLPGNWSHLCKCGTISRILMQDVITERTFINRLYGGYEILYHHYLKKHFVD